MSELRSLPSVDKLLQSSPGQQWIAEYGRPLTVQAIRQALENARQRFTQTGEVPQADILIENVDQLLIQWTAPRLRQVINATGVILHTNLGRAPLSQAAMRAMETVAQGYSNLEYDLNKGRRGSRYEHTTDLLVRLTGAEDALVVNNNASAVLLILTTLARRRRVAIARSQLVEIGGGFRIPEVMKQSGAKLVEVGTTNRVHLRDYQKVLEEQPIVLLLRAHRSNFRIIGFTTEPTLKELANLAHQADLPLVDDLGSGTLIDTTRFGLGYEPKVQDSLDAGADLVSFSGDKLLGGPQAGIIIGRADLVAKLRKHPLARALRPDKLCLAALSATLLHYLKDEAEREIPIWQMIAAPGEQLYNRAHTWAEQLGQGDVIPGESAVGGGSLPGETLPTFLLSLRVRSPQRTMNHLRQLDPPVIARVQDDLILLDPRTVLPEQDAPLVDNLQLVLAS